MIKTKLGPTQKVEFSKIEEQHAKLMRDGYWPIFAMFVKGNKEGNIDFIMTSVPELAEYKDEMSTYAMKLVEEYIKRSGQQ